MTARRIFHTARPTTRLGPVLPMEREDETFWRLWHEREAGRRAERLQQQEQANG